MALPAPSIQAPEPSETLYIRNLNERASIPDLTSSLQHIASRFGSIRDIVAKSSVNRKGQAFIVFENVASAVEAQEMLNGFPLFEKPMMVQFAKTPSDKTVEQKGAAELEQWKRTRAVEKERKQAAALALSQQKRPLAATQNPSDDPRARPSKSARTGLRSTAGGPAGVVPDEYLPPNKILFLQNIHETYDKDAIIALFSKFSGFKEVRTVPGRKNIAFVEYVDEESSIKAKNEMANVPLGDEGKKLSVTYQRQ